MTLGNALGMDPNSIIAALQGKAAEFLGTKTKLFEARNTLESLTNQARATGYVDSGGKRFTLAQLAELARVNDNLLSDNSDLERKFFSVIEEWNTIKGAADFGAEVMVGIPGIAGVGGLDAVPIALIAWGTGAAILVGSIAYFMTRVKTHLNNLAGTTAAGILSLGTVALLLGGAYLLLGRD